jgi:hypothetical protein
MVATVLNVASHPYLQGSRNIAQPLLNYRRCSDYMQFGDVDALDPPPRGPSTSKRQQQALPDRNRHCSDFWQFGEVHAREPPPTRPPASKRQQQAHAPPPRLLQLWDKKTQPHL